MEIRCLASSSAGNAYILDDGSAPLLIEAGIKFKSIQQALGFKVCGLAGCLISHSHGDHSKSTKDMMQAGVDCYVSAETAEALGLTSHRIKMVTPLERFSVGAWTVLPFDTVHDAAGSLGFLLAHRGGEKVLFLTDSAYCKYRFYGLTHILIECNYSLEILRQNVAAGTLDLATKNRIVRTHFGLENVKEFLKANDLSRVEEIWLIHLSSDNAHEAEFKREIQALTGKPTYIGRK